MSGTP